MRLKDTANTWLMMNRTIITGVAINRDQCAATNQLRQYLNFSRQGNDLLDSLTETSILFSIMAFPVSRRYFQGQICFSRSFGHRYGFQFKGMKIWKRASLRISSLILLFSLAIVAPCEPRSVWSFEPTNDKTIAGADRRWLGSELPAKVSADPERRSAIA